MAARDFPRFRDLPTELRLQIWSYCIPGPRVVEMDFPMSDFHATFPGGFQQRELWSSPAGWTPLVSLVCREARSVALNRVQYVTNDAGQTDEDGTPYPAGENICGVNAPVQLRKGFDIVHLNWHRGYQTERRRIGGVDPHLYATFQWLVNQSAAGSVSVELLLPFFPDRDSSYQSFEDFTHKNMRHFSHRRLYYAILAIVEIHISTEEAAQSGVFGVLGEEPIQLVDPTDAATMAKFRDVWERHQSGSPSHAEADVAQFFSAATDFAEAYRARLKPWRRELETAWLWYRSTVLEIPWETRLEFWPAREHATGTDYEYSNSPDYGWGDSYWFSREPNREHPWIQTQLALMPRFEPAFMFRHCVGWCGRKGSVNGSRYGPSGGGPSRVKHTSGDFRDIAIRPVT